MILAEKEKRRPAYTTEIAQIMKRDSYWPVPHPFLTKHVLLELFRNDEVLANKEMDRFTANKVHQKSSENDSEYELFSDRC